MAAVNCWITEIAQRKRRPGLLMIFAKADLQTPRRRWSRSKLAYLGWIHCLRSGQRSLLAHCGMA